MPTDFHCPACGRVIIAKVGPGCETRCPSCIQMVTVPQEGAERSPVMPTLDYGHAAGRKGIRPSLWAICAVVIGSLVIMQALPRPISGSPHRTICMDHMMYVSSALRAYAEADSDGMFPEAGADWPTRLLSANLITPSELKCPSDKSGARCSYIYVPGHRLKSDPASVLLYEVAGVHGKGGRIVYLNKSDEIVEPPGYDRLINMTKPPDKKH
jgi:hypothetical protein